MIMNPIGEVLAGAHHHVSADDVVVGQRLGVVAVENRLDQRRIVVEHLDGPADVSARLHELPVVLEVEPVFGVHRGEQTVHALGVTSIGLVLEDELEERVAPLHRDPILGRTSVVDADPARDEVMIETVLQEGVHGALERLAPSRRGDGEGEVDRLADSKRRRLGANQQSRLTQLHHGPRLIPQHARTLIEREMVLIQQATARGDRFVVPTQS